MRGIDITGGKFGRLIVIEKSPKLDKNKEILWNCKCTCGKKATVPGSALRNGRTKSCGCLKKEVITKHGLSRKNGITPPLYSVWNDMISRCYTPSCKAYSHYGGRGIKVCERWRVSFKNFLKDMEKTWESDLTLERINNDGDYDPNNCKWATRVEQSSNQRKKINQKLGLKEIIEIRDSNLPAKELSEKLGVHIATISKVKGRTYKLPSVGLIGFGYIGKAINSAFKHYTSVKAYDINKDLGFKYKEVISSDIIFIAVPTPMEKDGSVHLDILTEAIEFLSNSLNEFKLEFPKPVVIKSTIPPNFCKEIQVKYPNLFIIFSPEFLTERRSENDFIQQSRVILGVNPKFKENLAVKMIKQLFEARFPGIPIKVVDWNHASLLKYFLNVFFCTKISLFNEFAQIAYSLGINFDSLVEDILSDGRIGRSHHQVPGWDGQMGFSGSCFPKDCRGYINFAEKLGIDPKMAKASWDKNLEVRPEKDWEKLKGRAVSADS